MTHEPAHGSETELRGGGAEHAAIPLTRQTAARIDRLRRLIEYRRSLKRDRALVRCAEHVRIADLLLAGERAQASEYLREHLTTVSKEKTDAPRGHGV